MRRLRWILIGGAVSAVVVAGVAVWYFVFRDTAPPAVDIDRAASSVSTTRGAGAGSATAGLDGTWTVDRSIGKFSDFTSAYVGYRVEEELANVGAKTAFVVTDQLDIRFADYDIEKPTSFKVLSIEDQGVMELQLFFARK